MDEMKQEGEIGDALHEIAKRRDTLLGRAPALSPARRGALADFLTGEFAVEAILHEAAMERDRLLDQHCLEIPASVEAALHGQLVGAEAATPSCLARKLDGLKPSSFSRHWLSGAGSHRSRVARWRGEASVWKRVLQSKSGILLTAGAVIVALVLGFSSWETASRRHAALRGIPARVHEVNIEPGMGLFTRKILIVPFDLNTNQPASLQASLLNNKDVHFGDGSKELPGLRLELPVSSISLEDAFARTP